MYCTSICMSTTVYYHNNPSDILLVMTIGSLLFVDNIRTHTVEYLYKCPCPHYLIIYIATSVKILFYFSVNDTTGFFSQFKIRIKDVLYTTNISNFHFRYLFFSPINIRICILNLTLISIVSDW